MNNPKMYYVYILQSIKNNSWYIGYTQNLQNRISQHNSGQSSYTKQYMPYRILCYFAMPNKKDAKRYEKYLKSGYGRRTLKKMLSEHLKTT